ncbi:MAG: tetratricopeptide repeat protein [Phycisphaerales bacterium]
MNRLPKQHLAALLVALLALVPCGSPACAQPSDPHEGCYPVLVERLDGTRGRGFGIALDERMLAIPIHVIARAESAGVLVSDGGNERTVRVRGVVQDWPEDDIAVVRLDADLPSVARPARAAAENGERVWLAGVVYSGAQRLMTESLTVEIAGPLFGTRRHYALAGRTTNGDSGRQIRDDHGRVVAMVVRRLAPTSICVDIRDLFDWVSVEDADRPARALPEWWQARAELPSSLLDMTIRGVDSNRESLQAARLALESPPLSGYGPALLYAVGLASAMGDRDTALRLCDQIVSTYPDSMMLRRFACGAAIQLHDYERLGEYLNDAEPLDAMAYFRASHLLHIGDYGGCIEEAGIALAQSRFELDVHLLRGRAYLASAQWREAFDDFGASLGLAIARSDQARAGQALRGITDVYLGAGNAVDDVLASLEVASQQGVDASVVANERVYLAIMAERTDIAAGITEARSGIPHWPRSCPCSVLAGSGLGRCQSLSHSSRRRATFDRRKPRRTSQTFCATGGAWI